MARSAPAPRDTVPPFPTAAEVAVLDRRTLLACGACALALACEPPAEGQPTVQDTDPGPVPPPSDTDPPGDDPCAVPSLEDPGWVALDATAQDALTDVLGFAYVVLQGRQIAVAHVEPGCFVALERPCTHEGEPIVYRPERNGFVCPRHGAIYAWDGRALAGPTQTAVEAFPCGDVDGVVYVRLP